MRSRTNPLIAVLALAVTSSSLASAGDLPAVAGQPPVDPAGWYLTANHLHTSVGGDHSWHAGLKHLLEKGDRLGVDFAIITDHNTIDHWGFEEFRPFGKTIPIRGEEWTSDDGHAGLVMFDPQGGPVIPCTREAANRPCPDGKPDYERMVREVHARGGYVIINHPKLMRHVWPDDTFGADAVDVAWNLTDPKGKKGRAWWHSLLARGERIVAVGGSDYHYWMWPREAPQDVRLPDGTRLEPGAPIPDGTVIHVDGLPEGLPEGAPENTLIYPIPTYADPVNLVRADAKTSEALLAALRRGSLMVLGGPSAPRAFLGADVDGDGTFDDAREGDTAGQGEGPLHFQARVLGGDGKELRIIGPEGETSVRVKGDDFVHSFTRPRAAGGSFVRLEIGDSGECVGNPIFY